VKAGDLINVEGKLYPQLKEKIGVLVERQFGAGFCKGWIVMISGRLHPYAISEEDMELISESR
jgi:hypothetical protein